ncbi:hypothetical protein PENSOL_c011G04272 [Penicillium solitum]|uniref:Uncharacterized protein n=1 Tax=Penicillium solitum TaxID=60172 RepID=A0A1V6R8G1_9EURO|nr:uncharacterized protein PENSOL_c011G04272 [Penicillium solitum]OQD97709.1 hypothetical protein PENSOL_c011G04272 [Penicillium solitum]
MRDSSVDVLDDELIYDALFTITRAADDPHTRPCIIHWNPVEDGCGQSGMKLLFHGEEGLQLKELDPENCLRNSSSHENERTLVPKSTPVVLPGPSYLTFETPDYKSDPEERDPQKSEPEESDPEYYEDPPPPSPRSISPSARVNGAPIFSVTITGPTTLSMKDQIHSRPQYPLTVTVSYHIEAGLPCLPHSGMLTFHSYIFKQPDNHHEGFRIYRRGNDGWTPYEWRTHQRGFIITEPQALRVGRNDENHFWTLKPGESWSFTHFASEFPKEAAPGDTFRYLFKGATLDWWN